MPNLSNMGLNKKPPGSYRLEDDSEMPFGKYKGFRMNAVPADYLHYLWTNGLSEDERSSVADYIKRRIKALGMEDQDAIW